MHGISNSPNVVFNAVIQNLLGHFIFWVIKYLRVIKFESERHSRMDYQVWITRALKRAGKIMDLVSVHIYMCVCTKKIVI